MSRIIEAVVDETVNEDMSFHKFYGVKLTQNIGTNKAGTLFYVSDIDNAKKNVTFINQKDKSQELTLPYTFAKAMFSEVSGLEKGKTYTLKRDLVYGGTDEVEDFMSEKTLKKYGKDGKIVFPKGTKFTYKGADMSGDFFTVDGEEIPITDVSMFPDIDKANKGINDFEDIF